MNKYILIQLTNSIDKQTDNFLVQLSNLVVEYGFDIDLVDDDDIDYLQKEGIINKLNEIKHIPKSEELFEKNQGFSSNMNKGLLL